MTNLVNAIIIKMNRSTVQEERTRNAEQLQNFYKQVIQSFFLKMEKQFRYRSYISQQHLQDLEQLVRKKINFKSYSVQASQEMFESYKTKKETSLKEPLLKSQADYESTFYKDRGTVSEAQTQHIVKVEDVKVQNKEISEHEDSEDDLQLAARELNRKDSVIQWNKIESPKPKKQILQKAQPKEEIQATQKKTPEQPLQQKKIDYSDESDSSDSEADFLQFVNNKIGTAMVSTFSSFQVRRKPKQEKIQMQLSNVFVKFVNCPYENYFPRVQVELTKVQKENIKEYKA